MVRVVLENLPWMAWNTVLALVPLGLGLVLFGADRQRTRWWWLGVAVFVAFLPNAPYVLTDVIHLQPDVQRAPTGVAALAVAATYGALFLVGFGAYAASLGLLRHRLDALGRGTWKWPVEIGLHGLCAIGIFLGRVMRFNSWDVVVRPDDLLASVQFPEPRTIQLLVMTFAVLVSGLAVLRMLRSVLGIRVHRHPLG